jgi:hypothetical protein
MRAWALEELPGCVRPALRRALEGAGGEDDEEEAGRGRGRGVEALAPLDHSGQDYAPFAKVRNRLGCEGAGREACGGPPQLPAVGARARRMGGIPTGEARHLSRSRDAAGPPRAQDFYEETKEIAAMSDAEVSAWHRAVPYCGRAAAVLRLYWGCCCGDGGSGKACVRAGWLVVPA